MPYVEGVFQEPDNSDRAGWARKGACVYGAETRSDWEDSWLDVQPDADDDDRENMEVVLSDLLGDLCHLARELGLNPMTVIERGYGHHLYEVVEEEGPHEVEPDFKVDVNVTRWR